MTKYSDEVSRLIERINAQDFDMALKLLHELDKTTIGQDVLAILEASVCKGLSDRIGMYDAIQKGLAVCGSNYELYVLLGDYYLEKNVYQAYLCYENALFFCNDIEDRKTINSLLEQLKREYEVRLPKVAIVVLSYNLLDMTQNCIESIRRTVSEDVREIIVIDNASTDGSVEWLRQQNDIKLLCNKENEGFPKGCNQGIALSEADSDIFLLNNDTVLPDNALFWLRMGLYENNKVGSCGSVSNYVSNMQAVPVAMSTCEEYLDFAKKINIPMKLAYEEKMYLVGFALLLKRTVLNEIGLLDERFTPGNYEDNDLGLRILLAGYKNVLCKNSFILHWGSKTFRKNQTAYFDAVAVNHNKFFDKWKNLNLNTSYYSHVRTDIISMMENYRLVSGMKVLEIGCGYGATLARLKSMVEEIEVYGIELDNNAADMAAHFADVVCADVEKMSGDDMSECFDCIILGDVLEHLHDPLKTLKEIRKMLKKDGYIVASLPNVMHYSVMMPLLQMGAFTYEDAGILDRTHLHLFTKLEIIRLFVSAEMTVRDMKYTVMGETDAEIESFIDSLAEFMKQKEREQFLAYQYLLIAEK